MALASQRLLADFPAFFRVSEEVVVVVGGGEEALNKARLVAQTSARLRIVAEEFEPALVSFIESHGAERITAAFEPKHLEGAKLVFVATGSEFRIAQLQRLPKRKKSRSMLLIVRHSAIF